MVVSTETRFNMAELADRDETEAETSQSLVLVIEDDKDISGLIKEALESSAFSVEIVMDGKDALPAVSRLEPDLILLDLILPNVDGLEILTNVRRVSQVPIICVTARTGEADRVVGLEMGADDYMIKPFSPRELVARVRSVLRRTEIQGPGTTKLEFNGLVIDKDAREVEVDDKPVRLTSREFDLLVYLASYPKRVYSRDQLLENVWESSAEWQDPSTVTELVRRLRQKIEKKSDHPLRIETVRGVGYRFVP